MAGGWFQSAPERLKITAPGWFGEPVPLREYEIGWWAVLALDLNSAASSSEELTILAAKALAVESLAASSETLTMQGRMQLSASNVANSTEELMLRKVAAIVLESVPAASQMLALTKVARLEIAASAGSSEALSLVKAASLSLSSTGSAEDSLDLRAYGSMFMISYGTSSTSMTQMGVYGTAVIDWVTATETLELEVDATPVTTAYTTAGSHTYNIPPWCDRLDVICLGGGEDGSAGVPFFAGVGGRAGQWAAATWIRGTTFSYAVSSIDVVVGPPGGGNNGAPGQASTATPTGLASPTVSGAGGTGQNPSNSRTGLGPGNYTFNGIEYIGGTNVTTGMTPAGLGRPPGGGGLGGAANSPGYSGAPGAVWIRAYV